MSCIQRFSERQYSALEQLYLTSPSPSTSEIENLAMRTQLTVLQIRKWFAAQRQKGGLQVRRQINFSDKLVKQLQAHFKVNHLPDIAAKERMAAETGLNTRQISDWFSSERRKTGKQAFRQTYFDEASVECMMKVFVNCPLPDAATKAELREATGLEIRQIDDWFSSQRQKTGQQKFKLSFFTDAIVTKLRWWFDQNHLPDAAMKKRIAEDTGLKVSQLEDWFAGQRRKTGKIARKQVNYSEEVVHALHCAFHENTLPTFADKQRISAQTGLKVSQIEDWFARKRKQLRDEEEASLNASKLKVEMNGGYDDEDDEEDEEEEEEPTTYAVDDEEDEDEEEEDPEKPKPLVIRLRKFLPKRKSVQPDLGPEEKKPKAEYPDEDDDYGSPSSYGLGDSMCKEEGSPDQEGNWSDHSMPHKEGAVPNGTPASAPRGAGGAGSCRLPPIQNGSSSTTRTTSRRGSAKVLFRPGTKACIFFKGEDWQADFYDVYDGSELEKHHPRDQWAVGERVKITDSDGNPYFGTIVMLGTSDEKLHLCGKDYVDGRREL